MGQLAKCCSAQTCFVGAVGASICTVYRTKTPAPAPYNGLAIGLTLAFLIESESESESESEVGTPKRQPCLGRGPIEMLEIMKKL